ncbi:MAG: dicarboxylate/amino acid:cation symporter, partial [Dysosmobacter sp.]|nr:dicarboxylate/amino acid:cation symporter [Dysosmobacter sp.]
MNKRRISLPVQILMALILGIAVGLVCFFTGMADFTTSYLKPFGTIFVNLLKFIVVPVVLLSMIDGIVSMDDMKKVGSVGVKTMAYFLVTTAVACVIGLIFANIFNSAGLFPTLSLEEGAIWDKPTTANFMDTLIGIFPSNMWDAFVRADMLQVIVIALFLGGAILAAGEKGHLCRDMVSSANEVINRLMEFIISLSPIGVFTMMAWVVATQGAEILGHLALVLLCAYLGYIVHAVLV